MSAVVSTIPAPAIDCCSRHTAAEFLNARPWPGLGLTIGECPGCRSTRTLFESEDFDTQTTKRPS